MLAVVLQDIRYKLGYFIVQIKARRRNLYIKKKINK